MYMLPCCVCIVTNSFATELFGGKEIPFDTETPTAPISDKSKGCGKQNGAGVVEQYLGVQHRCLRQAQTNNKEGNISEEDNRFGEEESYYSGSGSGSGFGYSEDEHQKKCVIVDKNILLDMENKIDISNNKIDMLISKLNELIELLNKRRSGNTFPHEISHQFKKLHQDIVDKVDGCTQNVEENQTTINEIQRGTKWIIEHLGQFENAYNEPTPTQAILEAIQGSIENAYKEQIQSISKLIRELEEKNGNDAKDVIENLINSMQGMKDSIDAVKSVVDEIQQKTNASSFDNSFSTVSREISLEQNSNTSDNADIKAILKMVNHINKKLRKQEVQKITQNAVSEVMRGNDFLKKIKDEIYDQAGLQKLRSTVSDVLCGDDFFKRMKNEMLRRPAENWSSDKDIKKKLGYLEKNNQNLEKLRKDLSKMRQNHDEISNNVAELNTSVNNMEESFTKNAEESNNSIRSINESINSVCGDMCKVTQRIKKMEQDITQMVGLLNKQSEVSKSIEQRIDKLEQCVNQMVELLNGQSEAVKNLDRIFSEVEFEFVHPERKTRRKKCAESAGERKEDDVSNV